MAAQAPSSQPLFAPSVAPFLPPPSLPPVFDRPGTNLESAAADALSGAGFLSALRKAALTPALGAWSSAVVPLPNDRPPWEFVSGFFTPDGTQCVTCIPSLAMPCFLPISTLTHRIRYLSTLPFVHTHPLLLLPPPPSCVSPGHAVSPALEHLQPGPELAAFLKDMSSAFVCIYFTDPSIGDR